MKLKASAVKKYRRPDFLLIFAVLLLSLFGLLMVFSASYYVAISKFGNPYAYLKDDIKWMLLGWAGFTFFEFYDYHRLAKWSVLALLVSFALLLLIFTPLGMTLNNATRWLDLKYFTLMPGEIVKTALILFLAWFYSSDPSRINDWKRGHLVVAAIGGAAFFLIYAQPNLSTAGIVVLLILGVMLCAGLSWKGVFGLAALLFAVFGVAVISPKGAYMLKRIHIFLDPFEDPLGDGWQVVQSLLALGSGGLFGVGLGKSIQKTLWLPEAPSDFIGSIIGEEFGLVGMLVLMSVYMFLLWRCIKIALRAPDLFGTLFAAGIALHLGLQVILNMAVISASFAPTGVVLPLVSLGGNATGLFLAEMGIISNISKQIQEADPKEK